MRLFACCALSCVWFAAFASANGSVNTKVSFKAMLSPFTVSNFTGPAQSPSSPATLFNYAVLESVGPALDPPGKITTQTVAVTDLVDVSAGMISCNVTITTQNELEAATATYLVRNHGYGITLAGTFGGLLKQQGVSASVSNITGPGGGGPPPPRSYRCVRPPSGHPRAYCSQPYSYYPPGMTTQHFASKADCMSTAWGAGGCADPPSSGGTPDGAKVGLGVGLGVGLLAVAAVVWFSLRRRRATRAASQCSAQGSFGVEAGGDGSYKPPAQVPSADPAM